MHVSGSKLASRLHQDCASCTSGANAVISRASTCVYGSSARCAPILYLCSYNSHLHEGMQNASLPLTGSTNRQLDSEFANVSTTGNVLAEHGLQYSQVATEEAVAIRQLMHAELMRQLLCMRQNQKPFIMYAPPASTVSIAFSLMCSSNYHLLRDLLPLPLLLLLLLLLLLHLCLLLL